jgi:hypothetical protein
VLPGAQELPLKTAAAATESFVVEIWLRGRDLNPRPSGYEPDELPGCSTPHFQNSFDVDLAQIEKTILRRKLIQKTPILFARAARCDFVDGCRDESLKKK